MNVIISDECFKQLRVIEYLRKITKVFLCEYLRKITKVFLCEWRVNAFEDGGFGQSYGHLLPVKKNINSIR